jgi:hypothetical protein
MRKTANPTAVVPSLAEYEREEGPPSSAASALFTATQRRVLGLLFGQVDREFHMRELFASTGTGNGAVQRELRRLEAAGLVGCVRERGRKYYRANPRSPILAELAALVRNSFGLAEPLREAFASLKPCAELFFAYTLSRQWPGEYPAIDLLLVLKPGAIPPPDRNLLDALDQARIRFGRGFTLCRIIRTEALADPDPFIATALAQPRAWVFGDEESLARLGPAREAKRVAKV